MKEQYHYQQLKSQIKQGYKIPRIVTKRKFQKQKKKRTDLLRIVKKKQGYNIIDSFYGSSCNKRTYTLFTHCGLSDTSPTMIQTSSSQPLSS